MSIADRGFSDLAMPITFPGAGFQAVVFEEGVLKNHCFLNASFEP
jgi:hypothetical protein